MSPPHCGHSQAAATSRSYAKVKLCWSYAAWCCVAWRVMMWCDAMTMAVVMVDGDVDVDVDVDVT